MALLAGEPIESCPRRNIGVLCPQDWHALPPYGDDQMERYYDQCGRSVTYCLTIEEAHEGAVRGECVAVDLAVLREESDLDEKGFGPGLFMGLMDLSEEQQAAAGLLLECFGNARSKAAQS